MSVKLLTEHNLVVLSLNRGCTVLSEYTLAKITHCWKSPLSGIVVNGNTDKAINETEALVFQLLFLFIIYNVF